MKFMNLTYKKKKGWRTWSKFSMHILLGGIDMSARNLTLEYAFQWILLSKSYPSAKTAVPSSHIDELSVALSVKPVSKAGLRSLGCSSWISFATSVGNSFKGWKIFLMVNYFSKVWHINIKLTFQAPIVLISQIVSLKVRSAASWPFVGSNMVAHDSSLITSSSSMMRIKIMVHS